MESTFPPPSAVGRATSRGSGTCPSPYLVYRVGAHPAVCDQPHPGWQLGSKQPGCFASKETRDRGTCDNSEDRVPG